MARPILLVDDDRFYRELVTDLLARRGHRVVAVENGQDALEQAAANTFDLVVTDVVMPGIDGLMLTARLRERSPDQEVILVTSRQDVKGAATALKAGASDCITKPVDEAELLLAVERCLERASLRRERGRLRDENLEFARQGTVHQRSLELLANTDLEWIQERVLADLTSLCDAQSAALWIADERGSLVLRAYRGLLDRQYLPERIDLNDGQSAPIKYGKPWRVGEGSAQVLYVPLLAPGETVGLVQLSDPLGGEFRDEHVKTGAALADFAAISVRNGRKFIALQRLGLKDRDTAAYNLSYFTDYASKEAYKARRYNRTFSLLTFSIDQLSQIRLRLGAEEAKRATRAIIKAISRIIRDSDVVAKASEQEFYLLLPETDLFGAMMFLRRAFAVIRESSDVAELEARLPLGLVGGASTFPQDGEDFDELVVRCRRRMDEQRISLQRKLHLEGLGFWDEVELLLGSPASPKLPVDDRAEPSRRGKVANVLFEELQSEIARELVRDPSARGVLYVGGPEVKAQLPIAQGLEGAMELASRVYVLGRRSNLASHPALTPVFLEGDERMVRHEFLLWLSERSAYALLQRRGKGATWGFHTSDTTVVDGLISKLQAEYDLQPY